MTEVWTERSKRAPEPLSWAPARNAAPAPSGADLDVPKILVTNASRRLIEATSSAQALLDEGAVLYVRWGAVAAVRGGDAARLEVAVAAALNAGPGVALIEVGPPSAPVELQVVALHRTDASERRVMMRLNAVVDDQQHRLAMARARYGLTPAEDRVLKTLIDGCSIPEAARRLGVATCTARTHLQRVFDKTGARRQTDLLRLVSGPI